MEKRGVRPCPDHASAFRNLVYLNGNDHLSDSKLVKIGKYVYRTGSHSAIKKGEITLHAIQRTDIEGVNENPIVEIEHCLERTLPVRSIVGSLQPIGKKKTVGLDPDNVVLAMSRFAQDSVPVMPGQSFLIEGTEANAKMTIFSLVGKENTPMSFGIVTDETEYLDVSNGDAAADASGLFTCNTLDLKELGIGGLDTQFLSIFRRIFLSRMISTSVAKNLGLKHIKALLLYGPPGCGKTLVARQIGKILNSHEPKIVNGPELLNRYVGQSEENLRNLFSDAEDEFKKKGAKSRLHVIIFDEIDALCRARGSRGDSTGVGDNIVTQLLTKVDGVDPLENILIIGMTNRRDVLDEALLRPGRFEVQIEVGLPDLEGRRQILEIHTNDMAKNGKIRERDQIISTMAYKTNKYTGAELAGLVRSATSLALLKHADVSGLTVKDSENVTVNVFDFLEALKDAMPKFGGANIEEIKERHRADLLLDSVEFLNRKTIVDKCICSAHEKSGVLLITGKSGCGKSWLAEKAICMLNPNVHHAQIVTSMSLMHEKGEQNRCNELVRIFEQYPSVAGSVLLLEDIEYLIEYVAIGPRFSNAVLQTILTLTKYSTSTPRLIIITSSLEKNVLVELGVMQIVDTYIHVPQLTGDDLKTVLQKPPFLFHEIHVVDEISAHLEPITIGKLLHIRDIAKITDFEDKACKTKKILEAFGQVPHDSSCDIF